MPGTRDVVRRLLIHQSHALGWVFVRLSRNESSGEKFANWPDLRSILSLFRIELNKFNYVRFYLTLPYGIKIT